MHASSLNFSEGNIHFINTTIILKGQPLREFNLHFVKGIQDYCHRPILLFVAIIPCTKPEEGGENQTDTWSVDTWQ